MPPCLDVYVWVDSITPDSWRWFLDRHVHHVQLREPRWPSFRRKFIDGTGASNDDGIVAELAAVEGDSAVTIYLRWVDHLGSSITITREGATVLGISLDDPLGERDIQDARDALTLLRASTGAVGGMIGVELPPPRDRMEWDAADPLERQ